MDLPETRAWHCRVSPRGHDAIRSMLNILGGYRVRGLVILDSVETTVDRIPELLGAARQWPPGFASMQAAIDWQFVLLFLSLAQA